MQLGVVALRSKLKTVYDLQPLKADNTLDQFVLCRAVP